MRCLLSSRIEADPPVSADRGARVIVQLRDPVFGVQLPGLLSDIAIVLLDHRIQILVLQGVFYDDIPLLLKLLQLLCGEFHGDLR